MKPTLSPEDEALVRRARAHWERMRDNTEGYGERPGIADCALCQEYIKHKCLRCPVMSATGEGYCHKTPCDDAQGKFHKMEDTEPGTITRHLAVLTFREAAQRVIDWIDENLLSPASALADEQQLPSEITRATEEEE